MQLAMLGVLISALFSLLVSSLRHFSININIRPNLFWGNWVWCMVLVFLCQLLAVTAGITYVRRKKRQIEDLQEHLALLLTRISFLEAQLVVTTKHLEQEKAIFKEIQESQLSVLAKKHSEVQRLECTMRCSDKRQHGQIESLHEPVVHVQVQTDKPEKKSAIFAAKALCCTCSDKSPRPTFSREARFK